MIAVLGGGRWGLALAQTFALEGKPVSLWVRDRAVAEALAVTRTDDRLGKITLHPTVAVTAEPEAAVAGAAVVVIAVPTYALAAVTRLVKPFLPKAAILLAAAKGLERESGLPPAAVLRSQLCSEQAASAEEASDCSLDDCCGRIGVISGPNIAEEILLRQQAATVVACSDHSVAIRARDICSGEILRFYSSADLIGVQYGGALKNVLAIAAGVADGLGFGNNAKSALVARGMVEIATLGVARGARLSTFWGLSGVGDCMVTCWSPLSRNRRLGELVGKGASLPAARATVGVAEGVDTAAAALQMGDALGLELPITRAVTAVLFEHQPVKDVIAALMARDPRDEALAALEP